MKLSNYLYGLILLILTACVHDPILDDGVPKGNVNANNNEIITRSGLTSDSFGYYVASQRVPLVGEGRVINDFSSALVQVVNLDRGLGNLVDMDLTNSASFSGVADVNLIANQIASVRDINLTYAGGQEAGFAYKVKNESLLSLDVLKGFWIATYRNGVRQEMKGGDIDGKVLQLNLISFVGGNGGDRTVSISTEFDKPFDEIKIGMRGISAEVLQSLELYYAFVGDNPKIPLISNSQRFPNVKVGKENFILPTKDLIDSDLSNGLVFDAVLSLGATYATIDIGQSIPAGTEMGFVVSSGSLLELGIGSTYILTTYDKNGVEQERVSTTDILSLGLIKGSSERLVSLVTTKPCSQIRFTSAGVSVNLGGSKLHYAYLRDKTELDISSYYSLSDATITESAYRFHAPIQGDVSFSLISDPVGAIPIISGRTISNMTIPGHYVFQYIYTLGDQTITRNVTITKLSSDINQECNNIINTTDYPRATLYAPEGGGTLIGLNIGSSSNMLDGANLIDDNPHNYVDIKNTLSLIQSRAIVAVDVGQKLNATGEEIRTGFTFQTASNFLGLSALKFFTIKLYDGDTKVYDGLVDDNSSVGLNLIGINGDKVRFGVTTNVSFDRMELWTSGLLNINLNRLRLYNAYWEPTANCINMGSAEACLDIISQSSHGAKINYDKTGPSGTATVATNYINLGNIIDTDKESYGEIISTNVLASTALAISFDELTENQVIGFILESTAGLADVDLINAITLEAYSKGISVGSSTSGGLLGLDVISSGGLTYIQFMPAARFDEVRLRFTGVVSALKHTKIYGAFTRMDSDSNGIPDCAENPEDQDGHVSAEVLTNHICEGEPIEIKMTSGGVNSRTYQLIYYNYAQGNEQGELKSTLMGNSFIIPDMPAGDYYFAIMNSAGNAPLYSGLHVTVHPKVTAWNPSTTSTDWNAWSNWTNGTPWACTDVVISSESLIYPILDAKDENYCNFIHFERQTEVGNIHLLNYNKAWVDLGLAANRYHLLSAPLKGMVTGDMFIPQAMGGLHSGDYFKALNQENAPESRFNPRVYQRMWNKTVQRKLISGADKDVIITQTNWTKPFNALAQPYELGVGFSLWVDNESLSPDGTFSFRLPKEHTMYRYVTDLNTSTGVSEIINRLAIGRFISEDESGNTVLPMTVALTNQEPSDLFLVGNPFMMHLDIAKLVEANPNIVGIKKYDGNITTFYNVKDELSTLSSGLIAPMESFFIVLNESSILTLLKFNQEMTTTGFTANGRVQTRTAGFSTNYSSGQLRLTVSSGSTKHAIILNQSNSSSNEYQKGEDSELLFDGGVSPKLSLFSILGEKALDLNQFKTSDSIALGVHLDSQLTITLRADAGHTWSTWILVDRLTQKEYSMNELERGIRLVDVGTNADRFLLKKQ